MTFRAEEALALVIAVPDGHHDAGGSTDPVGAALAKIVRALPEPVAAQVEAVRRTTAPAPDRAAARPDPTSTALVQACSRHRRIRFGYRSEAGWESTLEVDPWAVVVRHGRWYLLCRSHRHGDRRAYRVDRVQHVEEQDGTFGPPLDLDPVAMLEDHLAVGWEYHVEVLIDADAADLERAVPRALGRLEPLPDGGTRLVGSTSNPCWYAQQLAGIPAPYRILGGDEIRHAATSIGRRMLDAAVPDP